MRHALKSFSGNNFHASARVVDGKLILSLPHALTPVVWQMDLGQAKASALEVHENKESGAFDLVLKTPRGESTDIAPFEKRAQAIEALMVISRALENAQGQIRPQAAANGETVAYMENGRKQRSSGKWVAGGLALLMLFVLFNLWGAMVPRPPSALDASINPAAGGAKMQAPEDTNGVPVSADDMLRSPSSE